MRTPRPITLLLLAAIALGGSTLQAADKPNVLFLLTDDQRADSIGALGNPVAHTPNLDALARRGMVFDNVYCMGSTMPAVCNPSRHMLLSGMSLYRFDPKRVTGTLGDVMNRAGYVTWHIGKRGNTAVEYHKAFQHSAYVDDERERTSGHHGRAAADRAIEFLTQSWNREQPLMMFIAFEGPHDPRVADKQWMDLFDREKIPLPPNYLPQHPFDNGDLVLRDEQLAPWPRTEAVIRQHLHDYYGCISSIDYHIGRILQTFEQLDQLDNTIVVFSSDHGLSIGSHGLMGKQNLYEHSMSPPLIFAGPGIPAGHTPALGYLFDIFPTIAELAGAELPEGIDGRSLVPAIHDPAAGRDLVLLAYRDVQRAVRQGDWKLIYYPKADVTQLFNLKDDPHELTNLADQPAYRQQLEQLRTLLEERSAQELGTRE